MKQLLRRGLDGPAVSVAHPHSAPGRRRGTSGKGSGAGRRGPTVIEPLEARRLLSAGAGSPVAHPDDANGNPPTVSIAAPSVTSASQATEEVKITFTDSSGIDPTSVTPSNISVVNQATGGPLSVTGATLSPADGSGTTDVATYEIAAPDAGGVFTSADNGTYGVVLGLNQVYDPTGNEAPQEGASFTINVPPAGATAPAATITPPATVTTALPSVSVTVTYKATSGGGDAINAATLNTGNILVTGPNGTLNVTGVSVSPTGGNASTLVATYTVAAPNGAFSTANDGPHAVTLNPSQPVQDTIGLSAVARPATAMFDIALPSALAATISPPLAVAAAQPAESIAVVYTDASGIDLSTISPTNLLVTEQSAAQGAVTTTPLTVTGVSLSPDTGSPTQVTATYTVAAPSGAFSLANSGTYAVALQANQVQDVNHVFAEPVSSSFQVNVPGTVALAPSLARLKLPAALPTGTPLHLSVPLTITNHGTVASAGTSAVTLFVSPTQDLSDATEVSATMQRLSLKVNKSRMINLKLASLPASLAAGPYYVLAEITDAEGNPAVAASPSTVGVGSPFVGLSGSLAPVPPTLKRGRKTSARLTVTNAGNVTAAGSLQVQLLARPAGTTGSADVPLATPVTRIKLAPGTSKHLRLSFAPPPTLAAGTRYALVALLDPANLFDDPNRSDNTLVGGYLFTVE